MSPFTRQRVARSAKPTAIPAPKGPRDFGSSRGHTAHLRGRAAHLLARHLRFHHRLLALWRHTADPPELSQAEDWTPWLSQRQHLLDALAACDGPRLAADTDRFLRASGPEPSPTDQPLHAALGALQARELAMMQSLLSLENLLRRILAGHQVTLTRQATFVRRIRAARRNRIARASYRGKLSEARALDQRS